jgi:hypothetical protein
MSFASLKAESLGRPSPNKESLARQSEPHLQCELRLNRIKAKPLIPLTYQSDKPTSSKPRKHTHNKLSIMAVKPITGMLRRGLVLDLSVAFGMPLLCARARARTPGRM